MGGRRSRRAGGIADSQRHQFIRCGVDRVQGLAVRADLEIAQRTAGHVVEAVVGRGVAGTGQDACIGIVGAGVHADVIQIEEKGSPCRGGVIGVVDAIDAASAAIAEIVAPACEESAGKKGVAAALPGQAIGVAHHILSGDGGKGGRGVANAGGQVVEPEDFLTGFIVGAGDGQPGCAAKSSGLVNAEIDVFVLGSEDHRAGVVRPGR